MRRIQLALLVFIFYGIFLSSLTLILPHFSHDRPNWSPSIIIFRNSPSTSNLFSKVSNIQEQTMLCSRYSPSLVSSLNLSQFSGGKILRVVERWLCHGNPRYNYTCTYCIICYHATQIVVIFHIPQLFLVCHNVYEIRKRNTTSRQL